MVHVTSPRPIHGWLAICGLALATISLSTNVEVSISTHHIDMACDTKCPKCGLAILVQYRRVTDGQTSIDTRQQEP